MTAMRKIIRAGDGWLALVPWHRSDSEAITDVMRIPVVAWLITTDGMAALVEPIFANDGVGKWALSDPRGRLYIPGERDFSSDAELIAYWNKEEAAQQEYRKKLEERKRGRP